MYADLVKKLNRAMIVQRLLTKNVIHGRQAGNERLY